MTYENYDPPADAEPPADGKVGAPKRVEAASHAEKLDEMNAKLDAILRMMGKEGQGA